MTVQITNYTTNGGTKFIRISNEFGNGSTNIINAVDSAITELGWTAFDTIGTTLFNPIVTKVYRCLNADGVTFKFLIIRWDTVKLFFYTSTCESWSTGTGTPTNESYTNAGGFAQGYDIYDCYFILSASTRHVMIWPFINRQPGLWTAVMEFERVAPEDLASVPTSPTPCFAWTSSVNIGTPWAVQGTSGAGRAMFCFPRLLDGRTGAQATQFYVPVTNRGMFPPVNPLFATGTNTVVTGDPIAGHLGSYSRYSNNYGWDFIAARGGTGKQLLSSFSVDRLDQYTPFGQAFNFGITSSIGQAADTILANIDNTGGWPSGNVSTSTNTECLLLPINGGYESAAQLLVPHYQSAMYTVSAASPSDQASVSDSSAAAIKVINVGDTMWSISNYGIFTAPQSGTATRLPSTTAVTNRSTLRVSTTGGPAAVGPFQDILFDGNRTVWSSTGNGIVSVDTVTYATTFYTSANTRANGCSYLGIDNKNIYAVNRTANTAPSIAVFDRNSLTFQSNVLVHAGTLLATASQYGTPVPDYRGNVFAATTPAVSTSVTTYMSLFDANTGIRTTRVPPRGAVLSYGGDAFVYDYISNRVWFICAQPSSNNHRIDEYFTSNLQTTSYVSFTSSGGTYTTTTAGTSTQCASIDFKGDINVIPFRGMHFWSPKRPGMQGTATTTIGAFICLFDPLGVPTNGANGLAVASINTALTGGLLQTPFQNSCSLTTNGSQLFSGFFSSGSQNIILAINGIYSTTTSNAQPTSRLIVKG
jgi:hypothetical protein